MSQGMEFREQIDMRGASEAIKEAALRGLREAAGHVLGEAKEHTPTESGKLAESGKVTVDDGDFKAAIAFDTVYAPFQHEDMTAEHDAGKTAKYLENALNSEARAAGELVAGAIRRVTGG